ncbi:MAG: LPXTG cell wall anchor domain-containing protein [Ruminococcaceae bacterium]|nr:LPXTG cell wall anchor domain-containing protein [Oscillospiraceae bacterium]
MKRVIALLFALLMMAMLTLSATATQGNVVYDDGAKECIFSPGSEYSPTDLFPNFKDVMPGDTLTQQITVKNEASNEVKIKIYMRSLGAHDDSVEFLSKLGLTVQKSENNQMAYMFDAAADETAQLTDWVCLGTLYSGGEVNLDVKLTVPVDLDNNFQSLIGYLDWEFRIEEFPIEKDDPTPPTGDNSNITLWIAVFGISAAIIVVLLLFKRKENN